MMITSPLRALALGAVLMVGAASLAQAAESGANSFTEGQAKSRIESAGYTGVSALKKDDQGVWRGTGMKDGMSHPVSLDFKGNVSAQ